MERFKSGKALFGFLIGSLGAALLLFGFIGIRNNQMIRISCDQTISANVISIMEESNRVNYVEAEFNVDNARHTAIAKHHLSKAERSEPRFTRGMQVTVHYSSIDPGMNYIEGANQEDGSTVFVIGAVLLLTGVMIAPQAFIKNRRRRKK